MKRAAEPTSAWGQLASRLGVEPKKLALLAGVAGGAIALLLLKTMLGGTRTAAAKAPTPAASAPAPGAAAPASPAPPGAAGSAPSPADRAASAGADDAVVLEVHLDTQPRRDPFASFVERPKAEKRGAADAPDEEKITPPDFSAFQLRATMDGEWVVINDQALRVGDVVGLGPDGTPIKLVEVMHRRATVEWRRRRFELSFLP